MADAEKWKLDLIGGRFRRSRRGTVGAEMPERFRRMLFTVGSDDSESGTVIIDSKGEEELWTALDQFELGFGSAHDDTIAFFGKYHAVVRDDYAVHLSPR
jgi:hypothetical protein